MPSGKSARRKLPFFETTDAPKIHEWGSLLTAALDNDVEGGQGTLAARPASGLRGRLYVVQGDATTINNGIVWWDTGTSWIALNTVNQTGAATVAQSFFSWGAVGNPGELLAGSGDFTVSRVGPGIYTVKWTVPKATNKYAVTATANLPSVPSTQTTLAIASAIGTGGFSVETVILIGSSQIRENCAFSFLAAATS